VYTVLKNAQKNKAWYQWETGLKNRDPELLRKHVEKHADSIRKIKWIQMIFAKQWQQLKSYCDSLQIRLIGDVPIYVAHDSADVWSNREIFTIDNNGALTEIAGVPPDLFNDDGQLWGMPIFDWDKLKKQDYKWWVMRIRKNLDYFNILRLDHFRGFSSYWSVPANSSSARTGSWKPGPGKELFEKIRTAVGGLPFIAEDLGEIDEPVYILRDELQLPGMNVLQFAFGDDMPMSPYLPHHHTENALVYTGTHDNNTTAGWFSELDALQRENLNGYTGQAVNNKNASSILCKMAYMSVSKWAIVPMQDILSLNGAARMNMPASAKGNWSWRLKNDQLNAATEKKLITLGKYYNRLRQDPT
jgi:4-alpha-glucanotransferase